MIHSYSFITGRDLSKRKQLYNILLPFT